MTPDELEASVVRLQDRQSIQDCLATYSRGVDRLDRELLISAYHPDAIDDHGTFVGGREAFADYVVAMHSGRHLSHQHCLLNHLCELDGDTAHCETYYMFVCMNREGPPWSCVGGRYLDRLERRSGHWAIAYRMCVRDWGLLDERPDMADLTAFNARRSSLPQSLREFMNRGRAPRRDRADPSYARPFEVDPGWVQEWQQVMASIARSSSAE